MDMFIKYYNMHSDLPLLTFIINGKEFKNAADSKKELMDCGFSNEESVNYIRLLMKRPVIRHPLGYKIPVFDDN